MDQINGQLVLTLACVVVAAAVLVRRFVQLVRNPADSGCHSGGCSGCPSQTTNPANGFVSLDQLTNSDPQRNSP